MLIVWIAGGVLSLVGALTYAELASTHPSTGGDYHFLTRAFGRDFSFFYAWARVTVITTGSIALLGFVLGDYLTAVYDLGAYSSAIYAALAVIILTLLNLSGLRQSARFQNLLTSVEIAGLLLVAVAGWMAMAPESAGVVASGGHRHRHDRYCIGLRAADLWRLERRGVRLGEVNGAPGHRCTPCWWRCC
jgi:amino acid transporter